MWKNGWRPLLLTAVLVLLGGCSFNSPEDLYTVPKAAEDYTNLQMEIDKVRNANAEYAGPLREAIPSRSSLWTWTVTAYRRRWLFSGPRRSTTLPR